MSTKTYKEQGDISYFKLALIDYLRGSHPQRLDDEDFIELRSQNAAEIYSISISRGVNHVEAEGLASDELYRGLHFSLYRTLLDILYEEFSREVSHSSVEAIALQVLPYAERVLDNYRVGDNFEYNSQYDQLYSELTGTIELFLEDELQ